MTAMIYTVACAICIWAQACPTQADADAAAERHERKNEGHVAYVHRPDMTQEAV